MNAEPFSKIDSTVARFLEMCAKDPVPLIALEAFVDELRSTPGWTAAEVGQVRHKAREILVDRAQHPGR